MIVLQRGITSGGIFTGSNEDCGGRCSGVICYLPGRSSATDDIMTNGVPDQPENMARFNYCRKVYTSLDMFVMKVSVVHFLPFTLSVGWQTVWGGGSRERVTERRRIGGRIITK